MNSVRCPKGGSKMQSHHSSSKSFLPRGAPQKLLWYLLGRY